MKNKKRLIFILILILAISVGVILWKNTHSPSDEVVLSGNVDIREVSLAFRVGGRVAEIYVDEGALIKKGQPLAKLDQEPLLIALAEAKANYAAALASQSLYHRGYRKEEIAQARHNLEALQAAAMVAKTTLDRQKMLAQDGSTSKQALEEAQSNYAQTQEKLKAAQQQWLLLSKGFRVEEIQQTDAKTDLSKAQLDRTALQLSDSVLIAPSDGILLTRAIEAGTMVSNATPVFTLSLHRPVWIRAYVTEPDLGFAAPGTRVHVFTNSRKKPYVGRIGFVSPTAEFTPKQVETADLRVSLVYRVRIIIEEADDLLRQAMPVTVRFPRTQTTAKP